MLESNNKTPRYSSDKNDAHNQAGTAGIKRAEIDGINTNGSDGKLDEKTHD